MDYLKGKKVKLRALEPSDLELLHEWENNPEHWIVSNTIAPFSKFILKKYIENSNLDIYEAKQLRLIIEKLETPVLAVGIIDLFDFDPFHLRAGIGIIIGDKNQRNKGFASEALQLLLEYAFSYLHLKQLYCNISTDNKDSLNLFMKHNFEICGTKKAWTRTLKGWTDEHILQIVK